MEFLYDEEPEYPFFDDLKKCVTQFMNFTLALSITIILLRAIELSFITFQNSFPSDMPKVVWNSLLYDLLFLLKILPLIFILFALVFFNTKNKKYIFLTFGITASLIIAVNLLLVKYFATALVPLGADLFGYSFSEIIQTVGSGTSFDLLTILLFLLPFLILWSLLYVMRSKYLMGLRTSVVILSAGVAVLYSDLSVLPANTIFKTDYSYHLSVNKAAYFTERSSEYFNEKEPPLDMYAANYYDDPLDQQLGGQLFKYTNANYPFLHTDETEDVLGPFFNVDSSRSPNVIIIQVEGLGRAFSGPDAYLGSFTPFLDNLASQSLYFKNFLASQGRTFASLPSIMGSLPFARKGFNDLGERMPSHLSLPRVLKSNGYSTRFYCGVDLAFDNQGHFLNKQGFNHIVSDKNFGSSFTKSPAYRGFSWGYADYELVVKTLQDEKQRQQQPFMSYIQTVSMHNPFLIPDQNKFLRAFEDHMTKLGFDGQMKAEHRKYKNVYSTILYTDQALSVFFKEYSKLPAYKNTIFVITGDHRLPEIPMSTKIDRYHVPLLIYSPLLKRPASISSVSSHLDITPTLLAFMKNSFKLSTPANAAWLGSGLDTVRALRNIHKYPVMQTKNDFHNYVSGLYFLDQNEVFSIGENMNLTRLDDENKLNELRSAFNQQKSMNERFSKELNLIPDSIARRFR